ncbi:MAG TPA: MFS transporter [Leptolyngbyaceae cyanobacterium]
MSDINSKINNTNQNADSRLPPPRFYRWLVLLCLSIAMLGIYYVLDCIAPIADLLAKQLDFSDANIGLLQAVYSIPNIFMVLISGMAVDRIGTRKSIFLFGVMCLLGSIITVLSRSLTIMASGRLIFGLGAESMIVAVTTTLARWFRGQELSFASGVNLMVARGGSWLAQNSPTWAKFAYNNWRHPLLISFGFSVLCVLAPILYSKIEKYAKQKYLLGQISQTKKIVFHDLFSFCKSYWYIVALCVVFYSAIFPFETFAIKYFIEAHHTSRALGGFLVSILTTLTMFGTPLFGLLADKFGHRCLLMMCGSVLIIPVYLMMAYTQIPLYIPMAMMGIAFSIIPAVMWPAVSYVVEESKLGMAYGLMTMIQNMGLASFNLLVGWANDYARASASNPDGYALGMWIFSSLGLFAFVFSYLLYKNETSSNAHGLETITVKSSR